MRLIGRVLRRLREQTGVTIVESMVAGLLLATGIGGGYSVFITSASTEADAERHQIGTEQAERALEQMRGLDYEDLKLTQAPAAPVGASDPNSAVEGTQLRVKPDLLEDLVLPADPSPGSPTVVPFQAFQLDTANSPVTVRLYRYVSWRDEECPSLDLTQLKADADEVRDRLVVANPIIEDLAKPNGRLSKVTGQTTSALAKSPISSGLMGLLTQTLAPLNPAANEVDHELDAVRAQLLSLTTPVGQLADSNLSGVADLCDLDSQTLRRLRQLQTAKALMDELGPAVADAQASIVAIQTQLQKIIDSNLLNLTLNVTQTLAVLPGMVTDFVGDRLQVREAFAALGEDLNLPGDTEELDALADSMASDLNAAIAALLNTENTTHNTKRLTVAVVIETSKGRRPPVWASTVVTDPDTGLTGG